MVAVKQNPTDKAALVSDIEKELTRLRKQLADTKAKEQYEGRGYGWLKGDITRGIAKLEQQLVALKKNPSTAQLNKCRKMIDDERVGRTKPTITYHRNPKLVQGYFEIKKYGDKWAVYIPHLEKYNMRDGEVMTFSERKRANAFAKNVVIPRGVQAKWNEIIKSRNPGRLTLAQLKDKIKEYQYGLPVDQLTDEQKALIKRYPKHFDRSDKNYVHIKRTKNFTDQDFTKFQGERINELHKNFKGVDSKIEFNLLVPESAPQPLSVMGRLVLLRYKDKQGNTYDIHFTKQAYLLQDIRKNLWVGGMGAKIEGIAKPEQGKLVCLGDLIQVDYVTKKKHIGRGELIRFWHPLGEVDGQFPKLFIDADRFPIIHGGGYDIWKVGIVN